MGDQGNPQQMKDVESLILDLRPFAEKMLKQHREFLPFGGYIKSDGEIVWEGAYDGDEMPLSQSLIDILHDSHRAKAANREIIACAVVYDIRTIPPKKTSKQDAICIAVDHVDGYSGYVIYPYKFSLLGKLIIEEAFATQGNASIFPRLHS